MYRSTYKAFRQAIASRLVIYVVLFSTFIMLFVTALQLYLDYKSDLAVIDSRLQQIENVSLKTLAHGLWIADEKNMKFHLEGLAELPDMQYFEIRDNEKLWVSVGTPPGKQTITRHFPLHYQYKGKRYDIGSLQAVASLQGVYQRLVDRAWLVLISNGFKTFMVSLFTLFVFYHLVTRHLLKITNFVQGLSVDKLHKPLDIRYKKPRKGKRGDEINLLIDGVNAMRMALDSTTRALKEREQRLNLHRERTPLAVIEWDTNYQVVDWNSAAEQIFGFCDHEVVGTTVGDLIFNDAKETDEKISWRDLLTQENSGRNFVENVTRTGDVRLCQWYNTTLVDQCGTVVGIASLVDDVTMRVRAEEELKQHRNNLEALVAARTEELARANKELEAFSYSVSHDLRAPLRSIDGFSKVLLDDYEHALDSDGQNHLRRIRKGTSNMAQLIDALLALSRVARHELNTECVDLFSLADEAAGQLLEREPERNVIFDIQEGLEGKGDRRLLRVVLDNLLGNAWKYSSKNEHTCIEFGHEEIAAEKVYFVRDNGVGFDMRHADKLFGVFQRLHRVDQFEGTGIGLATVQRIIHRHGGRVWAEGESGKGAIFYFTLNQCDE